jgi:hypothetical protein
MIRKRKIKNDILQILKDSGIAAEYWSKILTKFVNYAYKLQRPDGIDGDGEDDDGRADI